MDARAEGWEVYERLVARLIADQIETDLCVTPNARIKGRISHRSRQIDVLIESRHDTDNTRRIVVDAKRRKRKIDVKDVEEFRGLMEDVGATHGYLVCPVGHTKAAEKRAQLAVSIRLLPLENLENFDPSTWPRCASCRNGRIFWDGYPELSLGLSPVGIPDQQAPVYARFVHYVGKCDRCGQFHVLCMTCGETLSPADHEEDVGHRCRCTLPWFWIASIEKDEQGNRSAELHAVIMDSDPPRIITADRRSL
jgi:hypothetical protein